MQMRKQQAEQVQLWISLSQQPGVGGWLNVWRVVVSNRPTAQKDAAGRKLPQGACAA